MPRGNPYGWPFCPIVSLYPGRRPVEPAGRVLQNSKCTAIRNYLAAAVFLAVAFFAAGLAPAAFEAAGFLAVAFFVAGLSALFVSATSALAAGVTNLPFSATVTMMWQRR